jgi:hypothetical protein
MRSVGLISFLVVGFVGLWRADITASGADDNQPVRKPYGLEKRVPWTTSKVKGAAEPPPPYTTEPAFPKLPKFEEPLDLAPGHRPPVRRRALGQGLLLRQQKGCR